MNLTEAIEIRKLTPTYKLELVRLLHEDWKTFMSKIPETLEKDSHQRVISRCTTLKYNSGHIRLIEQASNATKRLPADILLEEWSSSGRVRPTLGYLFILLQDCKLYGAADYIAKLLGRSFPERPQFGPAAKIELTPTERRQISDSHSNVSVIVNELNYPFSTPEEHQSNPNGNHFDPQNLPRIIFDDTDNSINTINSDSVGNILEVEDMIQFSFQKNPSHNSLHSNCNENLNTEVSPEPVIPHFSALLNESSRTHNSNLPNLSILNDTGNSISSNHIVPDFDALRIGNSSGQSVTVSQKLGSPLPSLSLNTLLKHYTYDELEIATNYFNEMPFANDEGERSSARFLGSGAFGSVYLAFGIFSKPVAVKRMNLKDFNIIKADDFITKQFRTEVENIYKYKHDNLLSLLGYSCDGMTYCLLYEYVPGGNLKERLQSAENALTWTDRLDIARGTADAVAYLHTAYATPLIHRDIKSANILLDSVNKPKLCDFGIIRISSNTTTGTNQILGTSAYMPPEAHRGDVSVKMDTYSFGVVLLELLTALPPVDYERDGNDIVTYVQDSLEEESDITPLLDPKAGSWRSGATDYASELYGISLKCLQERKSVRPKMVDIKSELLMLLNDINSNS